MSTLYFDISKRKRARRNLVTALLVEATSNVSNRAPFREPGWFKLEDAETALSVERDYDYAEELRRVLRWSYSQVQIRTSKQHKVGVVPYRVKGDKIEVLLVTSKTHHRWILPKGNLRVDATAESSAIDEAIQEAGVEGEIIGNTLGIYEYSRLGVPYSVQIYTMKVNKVHEDWPEKSIRRRRWLNIDHAATVVEYEHLKQILVEFENRMIKKIGKR